MEQLGVVLQVKNIVISIANVTTTALRHGLLAIDIKNLERHAGYKSTTNKYTLLLKSRVK